VGALTVLVLCLFSAAAVIARRRRVADPRAQVGVDYFLGVEAMEGASSAQIARLKHYKFKPNSIPEEDAKCAICLGDYSEDDELRDLPCGHHFHQHCVDQWLTHKKHCPLCQQNIENAKELASHPEKQKLTGAAPDTPNQPQSPPLASPSFSSPGFVPLTSSSVS